MCDSGMRTNFRHGRGAGTDKCLDILSCCEFIVAGDKFPLNLYEVRNPIGIGLCANEIKKRRKFEVSMKIHQPGQENGIFQTDDFLAWVFSDNFFCRSDGKNSPSAEYD